MIKKVRKALRMAAWLDKMDCKLAGFIVYLFKKYLLRNNKFTVKNLKSQTLHLTAPLPLPAIYLLLFSVLQQQVL